MIYNVSGSLCENTWQFVGSPCYKCFGFSNTLETSMKNVTIILCGPVFAQAQVQSIARGGRPFWQKKQSFLAAVWSTFYRNWSQTRARRLPRFFCDTPNRFRDLFHQIRSPCGLGHFLPQMVPDQRERTRKFLF